MFARSDMVGLNIRKNPDFKGNSRRTVHHQSLRRYLHHHTLASCLHHLMKILLYNPGLRRRIVCRNNIISDNGLDRANQSHFIAGIFQNGFHHIGSRRLPLRSGDADDL